MPMPTTNDAAATVLAHQGGWDELLFVAVPMIALAGLLWLARRRAEREAEDESNTMDDTGDDTGAPTEVSEAGPE